MDINHKLNLVQELRKEQERRERDIYRMDSGRSYGEFSTVQYMDENPFVSFRIRLVVAILLFLCFFLLDKTQMQVGEIDPVEIVEYIDGNFTMNDLLGREDK